MPSTLEELPAADLAEWEAFEQVYGPILIHERLDFVQAQLSYVIAKMGGAKDVKFEKFFPRWDQRAAEQADDAAAFAFFAGQAAANRRQDGD